MDAGTPFVQQGAEMIVGQSLFDTILERVGQERVEVPAQHAPSSTETRGWYSRFVAADLARASRWGCEEECAPAPSPAPAAARAETPAPAFVSIDEPAPPKPKPAIDTSLFKRLSPEDVAKDINLLASDTPAQLQSKRRRFARFNHPDRTPMEWREAATTRMKIANHMVDEALRAVAARRNRTGVPA
ncbi:MAG: hypothetical protein H6887_15605 [Hoeflea sp.]|nr:hypothetical protein [Hoeflea sp.]